MVAPGDLAGCRKGTQTGSSVENWDFSIRSVLVNLPELTEEQQESLNEDESILLTSPIPEAELNVLESCIRLCGESIDILDARCLYAIACNKHTRDMYEANIGAVLRHLLESRHHPGKENLPDADD